MSHDGLPADSLPYVGTVRRERHDGKEPRFSVSLSVGCHFPDPAALTYTNALNDAAAEFRASTLADIGRRVEAHPPMAALRSRAESIGRQVDAVNRELAALAKAVEQTRAELTAVLTTDADPAPVEERLAAHDVDRGRLESRLAQLNKLRHDNLRELNRVHDATRIAIRTEVHASLLAERRELAARLAPAVAAELARVHALNSIISEIGGVA